MARARFAYDNLVLAAGTTITASSEVADRPAEFLASPARWKKWRSETSTNDQTLTVDFGTAQTVKVVALVDWTAHAGGGIEAEYWDGDEWQAFGAFTLPSSNPTGVIAVWDETGVSTEQIRVTFDNTDGISAYVDLGVLLIGSYFEPSHTLSDGFEIEPVDPSVIVAAIDGQEEAQTRRVFHTARGTFEVLGAIDLAGFRALFQAVRHVRPFLFAIDPSAADEMLYARLERTPYEQQYQNAWTFPVQVREVR